MTQEALAKGICSNTYISKIENNKIAVNKEHLFLIMERMGIPTEKIGFPEKMVDSLENAIGYFFYKDLESYEDLFQELEQYEFGVLIYVVRLGYFILKEDYEKAKRIYDEMYRYLNSLEEYGFATFLIFAAFYNIGINDYQAARMILESVIDHLRNDEYLYGMYSYLQFIVYGQLHLFNNARNGLEKARTIFFNHSNCRRLTESMVYANVFRIYEGDTRAISFHKEHLTSLNDSQTNYYLIMLAITGKDPAIYLNLLRNTGSHYLAGPFFLARHYYKQSDLEEYRRVKDQINELHYKENSRLDFGNLLKISEDQKNIYYRDYLINQVLPYLEDIQDFYFHELVSRKISELFAESKRYKEANKYNLKHEEFIKFMQKGKSITV